MRILRVFILSSSALLWGQSAADWPMYSRDLAGTRYSPLAQLDAQNVAELTQAWSRKLRGTSGNGVAEVTPIVIDGVMYLPASDRILALDADTGKEIWSYELPPGQNAGTRMCVVAWRPKQSATADFRHRQQRDVQPCRGKGSCRSGSQTNGAEREDRKGR